MLGEELVAADCLEVDILCGLRLYYVSGWGCGDEVDRCVSLLNCTRSLEFFYRTDMIYVERSFIFSR